MVVEFDAPADGDSGSNAALSCRVVTSVADVDVDIAWGADDQELYYCTMDDTGRPCRLHRLALGSVAADGESSEGGASEEPQARLRASCHLQGPRPSARDQGRRQRRRHPRALEELVQRAPPKGARAEATPRRRQRSWWRRGQRRRQRYWRRRSSVVYEETDARFRLSFRRAAEGLASSST